MDRRGGRGQPREESGPRQGPSSVYPPVWGNSAADQSPESSQDRVPLQVLPELSLIPPPRVSSLKSWSTL